MDTTRLKVGDIIYSRAFLNVYVVTSTHNTEKEFLDILNLCTGVSWSLYKCQNSDRYKFSSINTYKYKNLYLSVFYGVNI
jgi:hypothetical protein